MSFYWIHFNLLLCVIGSTQFVMDSSVRVPPTASMPILISHSEVGKSLYYITCIYPYSSGWAMMELWIFAYPTIFHGTVLQEIGYSSLSSYIYWIKNRRTLCRRAGECIWLVLTWSLYNYKMTAVVPDLRCRYDDESIYVFIYISKETFFRSPQQTFPHVSLAKIGSNALT